MNVLLSSVGRRSYLVHYFQRALKGIGRVFASNMYGGTPGMLAADCSLVVPPALSSGYVDHMLAICKRYDIELLCSLHDIDSYILGLNRERFEALGIRTTLPDPYWAALSIDKYKCSTILMEHNILVPPTYLYLHDALNALNERIVSFPLIIKARYGFGSLGLHTCRDLDDLHAIYKRVNLELAKNVTHMSGDFEDTEPLVVVQPCLRGAEYCVGICNSLNGHYAAHFSCEIHSMRSGESDTATSIDRSGYESLARTVSALTKHKGIWAVDIIDENSNKLIIDVNPRFTGDYPFHHLAGCDIPSALISWAMNHEPDPSFFNHKSGVRCYKDLVPRSTNG